MRSAEGGERPRCQFCSVVIRLEGYSLFLALNCSSLTPGAESRFDVE